MIAIAAAPLIFTSLSIENSAHNKPSLRKKVANTDWPLNFNRVKVIYFSVNQIDFQLSSKAEFYLIVNIKLFILM
jgi:hypothetical protein